MLRVGSLCARHELQSPFQQSNISSVRRVPRFERSLSNSYSSDQSSSQRWNQKPSLASTSSSNGLRNPFSSSFLGSLGRRDQQTSESFSSQFLFPKPLWRKCYHVKYMYAWFTYGPRDYSIVSRAGRCVGLRMSFCFTRRAVLPEVSTHCPVTFTANLQ